MLAVMVALAAAGVDAQGVKGERSVMGSVGYQSNFERFGAGLQGRYGLTRHLRVAPDVTFFFPHDKVTGLDLNVNFHYVFNFKADGQGFAVYPLAGVGMQNNFYGKQTVLTQGVSTEVGRSHSSKFAFNLGGGIALPVSRRGYLNAETRLQFAGGDDNLVFMLGYGYRF